MPQARLPLIQALRGVAVLLVIASHSVLIGRRYGFAVDLPDGWVHGAAGVDIFFVISGFVLTLKLPDYLRQDTDGTARALRFLWHRVTRIYPLYWIGTAAIIAAVLLGSDADATNPQGHTAGITASLLLWPQSVLPLLNAGWTLVHEMYFYLVFALMLLLLPRRLWLGFVAWAAAVAAAEYLLWLSGVTPSPVLKLMSNPLTFEFLGGCAIGALTLRRREQHSHGRLWGMAACAAGIVWLLLAMRYAVMAGYAMTFIEGWTRIALYGAGATLLVCGAALLGPHARAPRALVRIGDASYSLYLTHTLVLGATGRVLRYLDAGGLMLDIVAPMLAAAAVFAVGFASLRWLEMPLLRGARRLEQGLFAPKSAGTPLQA